MGYSERKARHEAKALADRGRAIKDAKGHWLVKRDARPDWAAALARRERRIDLDTWTDNGVLRDAEIKKHLEDADTYARTLSAKGLTLTQADAVYCSEHGIGKRTLQRWREKRARGEDFPETRGRKPGSGKPPGRLAATCFFDLYKRPFTKFRVCWRMVATVAEAHGCEGDWYWPSESSVRRWQKKELPDFVLDRTRKGEDYWRAHHLFKLDREPGTLPGNHTWEIDASPHNFWGQYRGRKKRFVFVLVVDVGTRMVVGHAVGLAETAALYVRAIRRALLKYGAPLVVRFDRGRALRSAAVADSVQRRKAKANKKLSPEEQRRRREAARTHRAVTGIIAAIRAEAEEMQPRAGWQKGSVESAVRHAVSDSFDPFQPGYLGPRPGTRIRGTDQWADDHVGELRTLEDTDKLLGKHLNGRNKLARQDMEGLSPLEKFKATAIEHRAIPDRVLQLWLLRAVRCDVKNGKIRVQIASGGYEYYGSRETRQTSMLNGQKVIVRIDDDDLGEVLVCDLDSRPLYFATCNNRKMRGRTAAAFGEAFRIIRRQRKAEKKAKEGRLPPNCKPADLALEIERANAASSGPDIPGPAVSGRPKIVLHHPADADMEALNKDRERLRLARLAEDTAARSFDMKDLLLDDPEPEDDDVGLDLRMLLKRDWEDDELLIDDEDGLLERMA